MIAEAIATAYPTHTIDGKVRRIELPNGSLQYEVELEDNTNNTDLTIIYAADGTIVCEE